MSWSASAEAALLLTNISNPAGGFQAVSSTQPLGQAFTVVSGYDAQITGATLRLNPFSEANLIASTLTLRNNTTGAILATFTRDTAYAGSLFADYSYSLSSPVTLPSGTEGALQLSTTGSGFRCADPATTSNTPNGLTHLYQYFVNAPASVTL